MQGRIRKDPVVDGTGERRSKLRRCATQMRVLAGEVRFADSVPDIFPLLCHGPVEHESTENICAIRSEGAWAE